ncbi:hypothetical protein [Erythrobacter sp.]|uniref:hypothetical protein n=1 Tax=Erythrobacter sp. TaxID=1042 RepID=UPI0025B96BD4|nr:hypothetical protein [Erythrobacter sp.]
MKATVLTAAGAIALTFGTAACIPQADVPLPPAPTPAPVATPAPAPTPPPRPAPPPVVEEPVYENYLDAPQTPGDWDYAREPGEIFAQFGTGISEARFILRCAGGEVGLAYVTESEQAVPRPMTIRTETLTRTIEARPVAGQSELLAAFLAPSDPLLDAMAITKGRFAVAVEGQRTLYLPAWVEVSRVIEDCR